MIYEYFHDRKIRKLLSAVEKYIEANYCPPSAIRYSRADVPAPTTGKYSLKETDNYSADDVSRLMHSSSYAEVSRSLSSKLNQTFSDRLIELINQRAWRDADVYRAAGMDRRLFSKIMCDKYFKPARDTALALVFALHLDLNDAADLLSRAGFVLSHSSKRDVILEYFLRERVYDLTFINEVLDNLGEKIIGR